MKTLSIILVLCFNLVLVKNANAGAVRLVKHLRACCTDNGCQSLPNVAKVDSEATMAINSLEAAGHDLSDAQKSCENVTGSNTYNGDNSLSKLNKDFSKLVNNENGSIVSSSNKAEEAIKKLKLLAYAFNSLGHSSCLKSIKATHSRIEKMLKENKAAGDKIEECANKTDSTVSAPKLPCNAMLGVTENCYEPEIDEECKNDPNCVLR
ncbi:MAG: hypothetical protein M9962_13200 [Oligoflexia bacterium]|nr:hypothetical protein [Oligoflexia bacterium]